MDGDTGVLDVEIPVESSESSEVESSHSTDTTRKAEDKAYSDYIKSLREDGDAGKFARRVKDDYSRLQALGKIDPKGIDGIRARYDALNGVAHGDKTGIDAVQSIQEALAESQTVLDAIAQGDMKSLSEDQLDGVLKMAPGLIDHLAESNPDAYSALLLPHFMDGLKSSALYSSLNSMLAALNQKPPSWLTKEQLPQWTLEHVGSISEHAKQMAQWFQTQDDRVKQLGGKETVSRGTVEEAKSGNPEFWKQSVYPKTNQHAEETFSKELRPWAEKLAKAGIRLSEAKKTALAQELITSVSGLAGKNPAYTGQMKRFNSQRSPDAASVVSTFKSEFNKHAKSVLENLIRRDYGQVLDKGGNRLAPKTGGNVVKAPVSPGVKVVSVKPSRDAINFQKTPTDWIYQNKWILKSGETVQFRP
jgi:hypothetical protein